MAHVFRSRHTTKASTSTESNETNARATHYQSKTHRQNNALMPRQAPYPHVHLARFHHVIHAEVNDGACRYNLHLQTPMMNKVSSSKTDVHSRPPFPSLRSSIESNVLFCWNSHSHLTIWFQMVTKLNTKRVRIELGMHTVQIVPLPHAHQL